MAGNAGIKRGIKIPKVGVDSQKNLKGIKQTRRRTLSDVLVLGNPNERGIRCARGVWEASLLTKDLKLPDREEKTRGFAL